MRKIITGVWHCQNCGYTDTGGFWNGKWEKDFGLWGALYRCPACGELVELLRGEGTHHKRCGRF